jgi:pimeloyl-ACP methyl ester carboxylesterase
MVPDRIIPVIFVPGVMGSNLTGIGDSKGVQWRLDSKGSMSGWLTHAAQYRKRHLTPSTMVVDNGGEITTGTAQDDQELTNRGWGEVGALSYGDFLVWLENALNDFDNPDPGERVALMKRELQALVGEKLLTKDEVGLSYRYRFPVFACGYNWLDSNSIASQRLAAKIDSVIARYIKEKKKCEKVIIVTHSMGGLVARHCSQILGYKDKIFGVVHGVMPAIGAAAVYRRFKAGTEGGYMAGKVLGEDAAEMTAVLSGAPGPLQLLPTPEYGNGWLQIKDGKSIYSFPKNGDPYNEIYTVRDKWWSMCEDTLINPLNKEYDAKKKQAKVDSDWNAFKDLIHQTVKPFHQKIEQKYHTNTYAFYGAAENTKAYGDVIWEGNGGSWMRGDRKADVINARQANGVELETERTVAATLEGKGMANAERQTYEISKPDELGDGTVPLRSGRATQKHAKAFMQVQVGHEPAFKYKDGADNLRACRFTLRSIVHLAQDVVNTTLKYD